MSIPDSFYIEDCPVYFPDMVNKSPYLVERRGSKMLHMPPKSKPLTSERLKRFMALGPMTAIGVRGVVVENSYEPADAQRCWLNWAAIDVDAEGQWPVLGELGNGCSWQEMLARVLNGAAHIRSSKSGEGRHILFMFDKPYEFFGVAAAAAAAKAFVKPWVEKLNAAGIQTCVSGLPNLWVWSEGGKQSWIYKSSVKHMLGATACPCIPLPRTKPCLSMFLMTNGFGWEVAKRLVEHGIVLTKDGKIDRHTNVNIGRVKEALKELMPFKTKSKCRPEHANETNGFVEIDEYSVSLFSSADNTGPGAGWLFKIPLD